MAGIQTVKHHDANREGNDHNDPRRRFLVPENRHARKEDSHRNKECDVDVSHFHFLRLPQTTVCNKTDQAH